MASLSGVAQTCVFLSVLALWSVSGCCLGPRRLTLNVSPDAYLAQPIPLSVKVVCDQQRYNAGPPVTPMILLGRDLVASSSRFLRERRTFSFVFDAPDAQADLTLKLHVLHLKLLNTWHGFDYAITIQAELTDEQGRTIGTYTGRATEASGENARFTAEEDSERMSEAAAVAFTQISEAIERDYQEHGFALPTQPDGAQR
jgi:hypothetical protein